MSEQTPTKTLRQSLGLIARRWARLLWRDMDVWVAIVAGMFVGSEVIGAIYEQLGTSFAGLGARIAVLFLVGPAVLTVMFAYAHELNDYPVLAPDRWARLRVLFGWLLNTQAWIVVFILGFGLLIVALGIHAGEGDTATVSSMVAARYHVASSVMLAMGSMAFPQTFFVPSLIMLLPAPVKPVEAFAEKSVAFSRVGFYTSMILAGTLAMVVAANFGGDGYWTNQVFAVLSPFVVTFIQAIFGESVVVVYPGQKA